MDFLFEGKTDWREGVIDNQILSVGFDRKLSSENIIGIQ